MKEIMWAPIAEGEYDEMCAEVSGHVRDLCGRWYDERHLPDLVLHTSQAFLTTLILGDAFREVIGPSERPVMFTRLASCLEGDDRNIGLRLRNLDDDVQSVLIVADDEILSRLRAAFCRCKGPLDARRNQNTQRPRDVQCREINIDRWQDLKVEI